MPADSILHVFADTDTPSCLLCVMPCRSHLFFRRAAGGAEWRVAWNKLCEIIRTVKLQAMEVFITVSSSTSLSFLSL